MNRKLKIGIVLAVLAVLGLLACSSAVAPCEIAGDEVCNGRDDDCDGCMDGTISAGTCVPLERSCSNQCGDGVEVCSAGDWVDCDAPQPTGEVCNNADDDCDGDTDEDLTACGCTGGGTPVAETCNAVDDDCNQSVDDGLADCACANGGSPGAEVCNNIDDDCNEAVDDGLTACACTSGSPSAEVCNAIDDDCNGQVDDGLTGCACTGGGSPGAETCNNVDDDCNGAIDDGLTACACTNGSPGAEVCNAIDDDCNGQIDDGLTGCACTGGGAPGLETCNNIDDDCNGQIDDGLTGCGCTGGNPPANEVCNNIDDDCNQAVDDGLTGCACTTGAPGPESCNGIDDDCDGCVDEQSENPCTALTQTCTTSCGTGTETCNGGNWENCDAPTPSPETCNNYDDDCNGDIDDGLTACRCTGGVAPMAEICNAIDDDCNGSIDDGLTNCACTGGGAPGAEVCNNIDDDCNDAVDDGLLNCACTTGAPSAEICDRIDNDCNQQIDEDNGSGGTCGGFGDPCQSFRDCSSQICAGDMFFRHCSDLCNPGDPNGCPAGYRCYVGPADDYCLREFPPCDSDADCAPGMVCTVQDADDGLSKETECRPPLDPGGDPGDDCSSAVCANAECAWSDYCTEVCSDPAHCTDQYLGEDTTCILRGFRVTPGECGRDEQCPMGYTCQSASCRGPACGNDSDCATGYICDPTDSECVPQPFWDYVGLCYISCVTDADCPATWVCVPAVHSNGTVIQGYCRQPYTVPTTATGAGPCDNATDPPCTHGICFFPGAGQTYCTQLCVIASDCPMSMNCTPGTLSMGGLGSFPNTYTCTYP